MSIAELLALADLVKNETGIGRNNAVRIGMALEEIIKYFRDNGGSGGEPGSADGGVLESISAMNFAPQGKFYGVQLPEDHPELGINHFSLICMRGGSQAELFQMAIGYDGAGVKLWLRGGEENSYGPFNQISGGGGGTGDEVDPVFAAWLDTYTKELAVTKQGFNGEISPVVYPVDKERTIIGYRLGSNATDFSVTINSVNYTKADVTNVVVPVNTEIAINDVTITVGKDMGNVVLILK